MTLPPLFREKAIEVLCTIAAGDLEPDLSLEDLTDSRSLRISIRAYCATLQEVRRDDSSTAWPRPRLALHDRCAVCLRWPSRSGAPTDSRSLQITELVKANRQRGETMKTKEAAYGTGAGPLLSVLTAGVLL